ncbi:hypothetical protein SNA84_02200, partial [Escherichia coli]|nr:hypothetical protein [Escherichia coli]
TWELILDGYSESSYSATPRFAAARLPWFSYWHNSIFKSTLKSACVEKNIRTGEVWLFPTSP